MGLATPYDEEFTLEKVSIVKSLIPVLQKRLPKACNVYNMAKIQPKFQNETAFYVLVRNSSHIDLDLEEDPWILATYKREDYGMDINISGPSNLSHAQSFKTAILSSGIIQFDEPFIFAATDVNVTPLVQEILHLATGKVPFPCKNIMFYANPDGDPLLTQFRVESSTIELKRLDVSCGAKFLVENWPFAKSGSLSYVRKLIERNPSSGVFLDGKLVAGAAMNGSGMITMLHTLEPFRHKGYAQLCMNYLTQIMIRDGLIPCCTVELSNTASLQLQRKIGLSVSHEANYISRA